MNAPSGGDGTGPDVTVQDVRDALADLLTPGAGDEWLHCRIPALGGDRPAALIAAGEGQRVLDLIDAMKDGAFL